MADQVTHLVVRGDTLSELAERFGTTVDTLKTLNNLESDIIIIGQTLVVSGDAASKPKVSSKGVVRIDNFGLQSNASNERTLYVDWSASWAKTGSLIRQNTDKFKVKWEYTTGLGIRFNGATNETNYKNDTYTPPSSARKVVVKVQAIPKNKYYTATWSTEKIHTFTTAPDQPSAPSVSIDGLKLKAEVNNISPDIDEVEFEVYKDNSSKSHTTKVGPKTGYASMTCNVLEGSEYKVRCRVWEDGEYSPWSEYSSNYEGSAPPAKPSSIYSIEAKSPTHVVLKWYEVSNADQYEIEWATGKSRFDSSTETQSMTVESVVHHAEVTGLETGERYYFRVRAINEHGESDWTDYATTIVGKKPAAPTTWSSSTTVTSGETLYLYWAHNAEDGSSQTYANLYLSIGGNSQTISIQNTDDEEEKDKTSVYEIDTSAYSEGTKIKWKVQTRGILNEYSDWSAERTVDVYAPPVLEMALTNSSGAALDYLTSYPFYIDCEAGPSTQTALSYHVSIVANESYDTTDNLGNFKMVSAGEEIYSKYYDVGRNTMTLMLSADSVNLDNNVSYTAYCTVSMNSGLTATASKDFRVAWVDQSYAPNASIDFNEDDMSAIINPYCLDDNTEALAAGVTMSVYRREYDGSFTEIGTGLSNTFGSYITDPHPALDYARYRIVATETATGGVSYFDADGIPTGVKAVIIQWDEDWDSFITDSETGSMPAEPTWSGSMLKLPYNIDVSEDHSPDVSLVEYIGRKHPVSYYGTQMGETTTWNVVIPKSDKETLYGLRRLKAWMGDVYVREPSGLGYWANITVSFSQKHTEVTIPVTFNITRVEGGI